MTAWADVVARVRGLNGRLTTPAQRESMLQCRSLAALSTALAAARAIAAPVERAGPRQLELAIRRSAASRIRLLGFWAGARVALLAPLFEDEDRRTIRAMLRGASSGAPTQSRLAGLIPTPALPERVFVELSRLGDVRALVGVLGAIGSPFAPALQAEAMRQQPDPLRLETALNRTFAARATRAASRGDGPMRAYTRRLIDIENAWTALVLGAGGGSSQAETYFLAGGRDVALADVVALASASATADAVRARLSAIPHLAGAMRTAGGAEDAVWRALAAQAEAAARVEPLGTAPIIHFMLRQRDEVRALQRIVWGVALGEPTVRMASALAGAPRAGRAG